MKLGVRQWGITLATGLLFTGCVTTHRPNPEELVTPLPKLTTAILASVRWPEDNGTPTNNEVLVTSVFKKKPELKQAFAEVPVKVWHNSNDVVVLICSPDGKTAWLEDASWTFEVDCLWYQSNLSHSAEFSLIPVTSEK